MHIDAYATQCIKSSVPSKSFGDRRPLALADAILACLTEHPMTGYELAKTFDSSIGFFWKADHQQVATTVSAVGDLQYLDSNADLFSDFDALDDAQTETN